MGCSKICFQMARGQKLGGRREMESLQWTSGLLVGRGKKVKFRGIFKVKFAEKMADLNQEFLRPVSPKNDL